MAAIWRSVADGVEDRLPGVIVDGLGSNCVLGTQYRFRNHARHAHVIIMGVCTRDLAGRRHPTAALKGDVPEAIGALNLRPRCPALDRRRRRQGREYRGLRDSICRLHHHVDTCFRMTVSQPSDTGSAYGVGGHATNIPGHIILATGEEKAWVMG